MMKRKDNYSVFVGHLSLSTTKADVYEVFKSCGNISDVFVLKTEESNFSYGFVRYSEKESALKAVQDLNKWPLHGVKMVVDLARETRLKIEQQEESFSRDTTLLLSSTPPENKDRHKKSESSCYVQDVMNLSRFQECCTEVNSKSIKEGHKAKINTDKLLHDISVKEYSAAANVSSELVNYQPLDLHKLTKKFLSNHYGQTDRGISEKDTKEFFLALEVIMDSINSFTAFCNHGVGPGVLHEAKTERAKNVLYQEGNISEELENTNDPKRLTLSGSPPLDKSSLQILDQIQTLDDQKPEQIKPNKYDNNSVLNFKCAPSLNNVDQNSNAVCPNQDIEYCESEKYFGKSETKEQKSTKTENKVLENKLKQLLLGNHQSNESLSCNQSLKSNINGSQVTDLDVSNSDLKYKKIIKCSKDSESEDFGINPCPLSSSEKKNNTQNSVVQNSPGYSKSLTRSPFQESEEIARNIVWGQKIISLRHEGSQSNTQCNIASVQNISGQAEKSGKKTLNSKKEATRNIMEGQKSLSRLNGSQSDTECYKNPQKSKHPQLNPGPGLLGPAPANYFPGMTRNLLLPNPNNSLAYLNSNAQPNVFDTKPGLLGSAIGQTFQHTFPIPPSNITSSSDSFSLRDDQAHTNPSSLNIFHGKEQTSKVWRPNGSISLLQAEKAKSNMTTKKLSLSPRQKSCQSDDENSTVCFGRGRGRGILKLDL